MAIGGSALARLRVLDRVSGVAAHAIDSVELAEPMPLLAGYSGPAMFDQAGGAIRTRAAIKALAGQLGDAVVTGDVVSIDPRGSGTVEVRNATDGLSTRTVRLTFAVKAAAPARVACLQDGSGDFGEVGVYAAPLPGNSRYSVGLSETVCPLLRDRPPVERGRRGRLGGRSDPFRRRSQRFKPAPSLGRAATGDGLAPELAPQARLGEPQQ